MTLKQKTIAGLAWNGVGNIARQALQIISLIIVARFLPPDDFGIFAILMVFVSFMNILGDMGTSRVIIHLDKLDQRMLSSIFYFNIAIGAILFGAIFLLARPIAVFFENYELTHLLQIIGLIFVIIAFGLVQKSLLEKSLHFKQVVAIETVALTISSVAGIVAAISGLGVYSLIIMALLKSFLFSIGFWLKSWWRPSFIFSFVDIKKVLNYSLNLTGFSIINYFSRHADNFLIGKFIGSTALGVYNVAYKIMLYPLDNISRVIVRVLFPAFSQIKHDNTRFKNGYLKAITFIAIVTFPLMAGLFALSETFVLVVLGDKWRGMVALLMILAPVGMIQSIVTTVGSIYTVKGTTGLMFKIGVVNSIVTVISFIIGLPFGIKGVAIAYAIANVIMLYPNLKIAWRQIDLGVLEASWKVMPFFISAMIMAIFVYFVGAWLKAEYKNSFFILSLQLLVGILIYVSYLFLFYKQRFLKLFGIFRRT